MARKTTALDDVIQTAVDFGELIGNYLYHGWEISPEIQYQWESILDGTMAQEEGFPDHEEEIAEAASHARHCAFHTHNVESCDAHVAEYVMSQYEDVLELYR